MSGMAQLIPTPGARWWNANRTPRRAPSPFLGGGEKVAAGRMRGGAANADARNPSPQPSPSSEEGRGSRSARGRSPSPRPGSGGRGRDAGRAFVVAAFRLRFGLGGPDAQAEACDYGRRWWHELASKRLPLPRRERAGVRVKTCGVSSAANAPLSLYPARN